MASAADAILKKVPKTPRARREIKQRQAKIVENVKKSMIIKGPKVSQVITDCLKDWHKLKAPESKMFLKKNVTRPFEDQTSLEFLARMNDSSLFAFGCHAKKRPHCLVLGRLFDGQVLDMLELTIDGETFRSIADYEPERKATVRVASKPLFIFQGDDFDTNEDLKVARNLILDYFRGEVIPKINLAGLDRVIVCTAVGTQIFFRHYGIRLQKSDSKLPRVELEEVGPHIDFTFRRRKTAADDLVKAALKTPKELKDPLKKRNRVPDSLDMSGGASQSRIHVGRADYSGMALAQLKGLRKGGKRKVDEDGNKLPRTPATGFGPNQGPKASSKGNKKQKTAPAALPPTSE